MPFPAGHLPPAIEIEATILVVEDDWLLANELAERLRRYGFKVAGPAPRVSEALALIGRQQVDAALLDVSLQGECCAPVAEALARQGVGFAFLTGGDRESLPAGYRERPMVAKPAPASRIREQLKRLLARRAIRV